MDFFVNLEVCLSASFTQYTVTITQVLELVSAFNPESESRKYATAANWQFVVELF